MHAYRIPELIALLDADACFPTAPFDSEETLAALTRLGMKSSVGSESILQSAQYIAELGLQDTDQAHERCLPHIHPCTPLSQVSTLPWWVLTMSARMPLMALHALMFLHWCVAQPQHRVIKS